MRISDRLKEIQGKMSVREFAQALDISSSSIHGYLQGRTPPVEVIVLICGRFDVSPWWLLTGEGVKNRRRLAQFEEIVEALEKNDQLAVVVRQVMKMDPVALRALQGLVDYQAAMHVRCKALNGMVHYLDLILEKLGIAKDLDHGRIEN